MRNELYHHGVLGMKWGVRRYQNKDGTLTSAGKKKYRKSSNTKRYIAAGCVAVAVALVAAKTYHSYGSGDFDFYIKAGKDFYRMANKNEKIKGLNDLVYATPSRKDHEVYKRAYSEKDAESLTLSANKSLKVAGNKNGRRVFEQLLKEDKDFYKRYGNMSYKDFNASFGLANRLMVEQGISLKDTYMYPFVKALRNEGYSGMYDVGGTAVKKPVVLFNEDKKLRVK